MSSACLLPTLASKFKFLAFGKAFKQRAKILSCPEMESLYVQSRTLEAKDLGWIRQLIDAHPDWNRTN